VVAGVICLYFTLQNKICKVKTTLSFKSIESDSFLFDEHDSAAPPLPAQKAIKVIRIRSLKTKEEKPQIHFTEYILS